MSTYIPSRVIVGNRTSVQSMGIWPTKEFPSDEYWADGNDPKVYKWEMTFTIQPQTHSSPATRVPYTYNGLDIVSGMWVTDVSGVALRITEVVAKSNTSVKVVVEDEFRINTFKDTSGGASGEFKSSGDRVFFELDDEGMPILDPVPSGFDISNAVAGLISRFQRWNQNKRYAIVQPGHDIEDSDIIVANSSTSSFEKLTNDNKTSHVVGTVLETYPDRFYISPVNRIIRNFMPPVPGNVANFVYYDSNNSQYTTEKTLNRVFIKMTPSVPSTILGNNEFTDRTPNTTFSINGVDITVSDTDQNTLISDINALTNEHDVTASIISSETVAEGELSNTAFGVVYVAYPASCEVNGTLVTFESDDGSTYAQNDEVVQIINEAGIPNITAEDRNGRITLVNDAGGDIIIENIQNDAYGNPVAGPSSGTGLPLETLSNNNAVFIKLTRQDGGPINLYDISGSTISDLGLFSVQNGRVPDVMVVENWDRKSTNYVVQTMQERDELTALLIGDEAFVMDSGNGEWSKWLYDGSQWKLIATEDSARTDADVLSLELDYSNTGTNLIGTVSNNSRVTDVTIEVLTAFDDINASLNIGDSTVNDRLMSESIIDLTEPGTYTFTPSHVYNQGGDTDINAYLDSGTSTTGQFKVIISYS